PTACCRRRAEDFVDPAKIADCLHVAAVHSKHKSVFRPDNSYKPLPIFGNCDRKEAWPGPAFERMLTNRTASGRNGSGPNGFSISNRITTITERYFRFKRRLPAQCGKELCARPRFSNHELDRFLEVHK